MAKNFEIILNKDNPVTRADGSVSVLDIDEVVSVLNSKNCKYMYVCHPVDDMSSFVHYHVGIHTDSSNTFDTIAKWFNLPVHAVQKIRGKFETTYALYLIHYGKDEKTAIDPSEVVSNFELDYDKIIANINKAGRLDAVLSKIDSGVIREYNLYDYITAADYAYNKIKYDRAFEYRKLKLRGIERNMECVFITGDSGTGKTTYAKKICEDRKLKYYVSSGSNDVLDDYKGEPAIILDDLRPSCLSLSDLLKMLDNNTASTVKSRFKNKVLECELIIITTTKDIQTFFNEVFENENETRQQLMRRCKTYVHMTRDEIVFEIYNDVKRRYEPLAPVPNVILEQFKFDEKSDDDKLAFLSKTLGCSAALLDDLRVRMKEQKGFIRDDNVPFEV